ncbi:MAG: bleomycin resistance protein [Gemmatimonadetes bacterium]|jgi:catechol 2,3-dioxygenase-like lactoylglutathione lyase family enzyme|nr:MAG: bleomycin resistance protein [Gemmatimonadota bacterium]
MPKIKHIALSTQDPDGTARFYVDVFGMKQIGRIDSPAVRGYFLSDGDINVAILNFKTDAAAGVERGKGFSGIHHIGFQVESLDAIAERLAAAGSERRDDVNEALGVGQARQRYANVEVKYRGPDGVMLDVSETGWVGTSTFNP